MMAIQVLHNADGVWVSHFLEMLRRCMVPGKRCKVLGIRRGRQKRRWLDSIRNDNCPNYKHYNNDITLHTI